MGGSKKNHLNDEECRTREGQRLSSQGTRLSHEHVIVHSEQPKSVRVTPTTSFPRFVRVHSAQLEFLHSILVRRIATPSGFVSSRKVLQAQPSFALVHTVVLSSPSFVHASFSFSFHPLT